MELEKKEGIVIKSVNYQDAKRIITLFTTDGLISLMATIYPKQPNSILLTTPLCIGEFCYKRSSSDLHFLKEGSIISSHLNYNTSYAKLEAAFDLLKTLTISQLPAKPAPLLYQLSKLYLDLLPKVSHPKNLASSFMLKVMRYEGLFSLEGLCSSCSEYSAQAAYEGEFYCLRCMPSNSLQFEAKEWEQLQILLFSKDIKAIDALEVLPSLHQKISLLLKQMIH